MENIMSDVTLDVVKKISRLSRIKVNDQDLNKLSTELSNILSWVDLLKEVDTTSVTDISTVVISTQLRTDVITESNNLKNLLSNAPDKSKDYFTVPKVIE